MTGPGKRFRRGAANAPRRGPARGVRQRDINDHKGE